MAAAVDGLGIHDDLSLVYLVYVVAVADVTIVVAAVGNVADGRRVAHGETILHTTLWANLSQIILTLLTSFFCFSSLREVSKF